MPFLLFGALGIPSMFAEWIREPQFFAFVLFPPCRCSASPPPSSPSTDTHMCSWSQNITHIAQLPFWSLEQLVTVVGSNRHRGGNAENHWVSSKGTEGSKEGAEDRLGRDGSAHTTRATSDSSPRLTGTHMGSESSFQKLYQVGLMLLQTNNTPHLNRTLYFSKHSSIHYHLRE